MPDKIPSAQLPAQIKKLQREVNAMERRSSLNETEAAVLRAIKLRLKKYRGRLKYERRYATTGHAIGAATERTIAVALPNPVQAGSEIRVKTKRPALFVTDSLGNTYTQISKREWKCNYTRGGPLSVTVTQTLSKKNEITIEEHA